MLIYRNLRNLIPPLPATNYLPVRRLVTGILFIACAALTNLSVGSTILHSHQAIREAARGFLADNPPASEGRIETSLGRLDPRLRLAQCDASLQVSRTPGSRSVGRTTLEIRCPAPKAWKLLLPVTVRVFGQVVTAARTLTRGTLLRREDLLLKEQELGRLGYGYFSDLDEAVGKELRRSLRAGATLTPSQLIAQRRVRRGQRVTILANAGGIEVRMVGEALADGARDELVRVRNRKTKRVVEGVVRVNL